MKIKGFTLIELMITVACLGLLLVLASSATYYLRHKNEGQVIINEVQAAIQYAKIKAALLGHPLHLAPLDETTLNWTKGMVLLQNNKNHPILIQQWPWHHPHWRLTWSGVYAVDKIAVSNNPASAISNGQFSLFDEKEEEKVVMMLNRIGRLRIIRGQP